MRTNADQVWLQPPSQLSLARDEVHVWRTTLDVPASLVGVFERTLAPDELERAAQFRFPNLRRRFITGRGILRELLGEYLGVEPQTIRFGYSPYGKPFLEPEQNQVQLFFNVAHTAGMALYALALGRMIGIDIEAQRHITDAMMIAERFFSLPEQRALRALPAEERPLAFLRYWTQKEAYIKAQGMGLSLPLNQFSVTLTPGEPTRLLRTDRDPAATERWGLRELALGPSYVAALAVEGLDWQLTCWQWPG